MLLVRADKKTTEIIEGSGSDEDLLMDVANIADAVLGVLTDGEPVRRKGFRRCCWRLCGGPPCQI